MIQTKEKQVITNFTPQDQYATPVNIFKKLLSRAVIIINQL